MATIIVLGSLNMDIAAVSPRLPRPGETLIGSHFHTAPGGKGANQAYAAAKLGASGSAAMLGRVGDDESGRQIIASLAGAGCSVEGVRTVAGPTGVALILMSDSGENSIVVVPGANEHFAAQDIEADAPLLRGARYVLLQMEIPMPSTIAAARSARAAGLEVVLDPGPAPGGALPTELMQYVDVLTPNETEASVLMGRRAAEVSVDEARTIAGALQARGVRHVIVKLGAKGCLLLEGGTATHVPAPLVKAVDTKGAGDIFNAAFAVACSEGVTRLDACQFAVHAAASRVIRRGYQASVPTRAELETYLRQI